jgi:predicted AAA+ superfamily ATPase
VSATTIKNWLSVLKASYIVFELPAFSENIRKRVVKSSKIYFTDTGLAAFLLGIYTEEQAYRDPLRGNLYENLIIADIIKNALNKGIRPEIYFFRDSNGNEVDLLIKENRNLIPVEIKSASTFSADFLKGLEYLQGLKLNGLASGNVLYNGEQKFTVRGIDIFNPLTEDNIWDSLTVIKLS